MSGVRDYDADQRALETFLRSLDWDTDVALALVSGIRRAEEELSQSGVLQALCAESGLEVMEVIRARTRPHKL